MTEHWLAAARAGHQYGAGLFFVSTLHPSCDFETASEAGFVWDEARGKWGKPEGASKSSRGLEIVGAAAYAMHPTTRVTSFSYNLRDGGGKRHWHPGLPNPQELFDYLARGGLLAGWNIGFEYWIWNFVCVRLYGWPALRPDSLVDTMAKARAHGLPGRLDDAGLVLRIEHQKLEDGKRLLDKFSMPRNPTKADQRRWLTPEDDPVDGPKLYEYNDRDVDAETEAGCFIPDLSPEEEQHWRNDRAINVRGVQIDVQGVENCIAIVRQALVRYGDELERLAGCKPSELAQLQGWLGANGLKLDNMREDTIEKTIEADNAARKREPRPDGSIPAPLPPHVRRALEIRVAVGSASVKKVFAMRNQASPLGRLHDLYNYHGARTGRPTGYGPQPTNLPKAGPNVYRCGFFTSDDTKPADGGGCGRFYGHRLTCCPWCTKVRGPRDSMEWNPAVVEDALLVIATRSLECVELYFGDAMHVIAGCLRGLFIAKDGCELVSSDFSSIEGVVIAALAGEEWRLEVFRTHGMMYEMSASKILGIPFEEFVAHKKRTGQHHPARQVPGKPAELGLGFGGWIGAWRKFKGPGTDEEVKRNIIAWRNASPALVHLWGGQREMAPGGGWRNRYFGLEGAAVKAVTCPGTEYHVDKLDGSPTGISYIVHEDVLYCKVPSGGLITYQSPILGNADPNTPWRGLPLSYMGWNTNPEQGMLGWVRMSLYSGKCAENVVQKVARDIQMPAIDRVEKRGWPVVMHTYDEIVSEVPIGSVSIEEYEEEMMRPLGFTRTWPVKAKGGWRGRRYRK